MKFELAWEHVLHDSPRIFRVVGVGAAVEDVYVVSASYARSMDCIKMTYGYVEGQTSRPPLHSMSRARKAYGIERM